MGGSTKLTASDAAADDQFGFAVSISGDMVIVGSNLDDDNGNNSGSAYIYELTGGSWVESKIIPSDGAAGDKFGHTVSLSGNIAIVGSVEDDDNGNNSGSAYIYELTNGVWVEAQKLSASDAAADDQFGYAVSIDGNVVVIGARFDDKNINDQNSGSAYVFENNGTNWSETQKLTASDADGFAVFGFSVDVSNNYIVIGSPYRDYGVSYTNSGASYVFENNGTNWTEIQLLTASDEASYDNFGYSVSISDNRIITSSHLDDDNGNNSGSAYIFELDGTSWTQAQKINASDGNNSDVFGNFVSISGNNAIAGSFGNDENGSESGAAYIFGLPSFLDVQTACDSYTWIDGITYTSSNNTATHTLSNAEGCDSIVTLSLTINNSSSGIDVQTACDNYTWIDGITYTSSNNTATHTLSNASSCDSIVTLDLTITNSSSGTDVQTACDSYIWIDGITYTSSNNTATHTLTNAVGCDSVVTLNLTILNAPPVITCSTGINAQTSDDGPGDCTTTVVVGNPGVTDDCDVPTLIVQINGVIEDPNTYAYPVGTTQLEWIATDNAGNADTCYQDINITDNEPPIVINCPLGTQVGNDLGDCGAIVTFSDATFSDNCTGLQVDVTGGLPSGSLFPIGLTTVVYTATDVGGNQTSCEIDIVVVDVELPTFTGCPNDTIISASGVTNSCSASFTYDTVDVNDNCPGTTLEQFGIPSGGTFPLGVSVVSWIATPTTGNADTCSFTVTVIDDLPPSFINCPADISMEVGTGTCDGTVSWTPLSCVDNCSCTIEQISGIPNDSIFPLGTTFNQFVATDPDGNMDTCSFTVTITDNIPPSIICPTDIVVNNLGTVCGPQVVNYSPPSSTDNCATVTNVLIEGPESGEIFPIGITNVSYVASDGAGNTDTCSFTVTVNDSLPPPGAIDSIYGPTEICNNVSPFYSVNQVANAQDYLWTIVGGSIDVGATGSSMTNKKINWGPQGSGQVIVQAVNNCYTGTADTLNVTIYDAPYPVDAGPDSTTLCAPITNYTLQATPPTVGVGTWSVIQGGATVVDVLDPNSDVTNLSPGINIFRWTVENVICSSSSDIYIIPDAENPIALCQNLVRYMPPSGSFSITPQEVDMGSTDNCSIQSLALSQSTFTCLNVGVTTIDLLVTDSIGNVGGCSADITIIDTVPPTAICQDITVQLDGLGEYSLEAQEVNGGSVDNCIIDSLIVEPNFFNCTHVGTNLVTLIIVDKSGNRDSCNAVVTIQDSDGPTINACNDATLYLDSSGTAVLDPNTLFSASPTDPCGLASITTDVPQNTFTCDDTNFPTNFPNVVTVTATDNNGNQSTCSSLVTVVDNISPVVMCSDTTLILDSTGILEITDAYIFDNGSWDSCGITQFVAFPAVFDCSDVGPNTVTVTITDANGNSSTCTPTVTILSDFTSTSDTTVCDSYTWNGTTYTTSGTYTFTISNSVGCDSLAILNLTINNSITTTDSLTACDSFTWIDGITYTSSNNTATLTLTNAAGCDSIVTLNLTITNSSSGTDVQAACDSYTWIDGITYTSSNNTATDTLSNAVGCDSIVTLNLTIINSSSGTDVQAACDSYTWIDGITYTSSNNIATDTLTNAVGCDSIVTLDLTITNSSSGTDIQTACLSYTWIDGITYTASNNTATDTLSNAVGCDSIVTLNLTITNFLYGTDVQTACNSYTWIDGITYTASNNTAADTIINSIGCDSIVTLNLTITNSSSGTDVQTACNSYTWIDGITYASSNNTATDTLTNAAGCDSIVTLNLTINNVDNGITNNSPTLSANLVGATYQWLDCDNNFAELNGETNQSFTALANGNYAVEVTQNDCADTSACENVSNVGISEIATNINLHPNPTSDQITIDIKGYNGPINIEVYDLSGRLLETTTNTIVSLKKQAKGIYVFRVSYGEVTEEIRVVKQ